MEIKNIQLNLNNIKTNIYKIIWKKLDILKLSYEKKYPY